MKIECCFWKLGNSSQVPRLSGINSTYLLIKEMSWIVALFVSFSLLLSPWKQDEKRVLFMRTCSCYLFPTKLPSHLSWLWKSYHHQITHLHLPFHLLNLKSLIWICMIWGFLLVPLSHKGRSPRKRCHYQKPDTSTHFPRWLVQYRPQEHISRLNEWMVPVLSLMLWKLPVSNYFVIIIMDLSFLLVFFYLEHDCYFLDDRGKIFHLKQSLWKALCMFLFSCQSPTEWTFTLKWYLTVRKVGCMECPETRDVAWSLICCFVSSQSPRLHIYKQQPLLLDLSSNMFHFSKGNTMQKANKNTVRRQMQIEVSTRLIDHYWVEQALEDLLPTTQRIACT